MNIITHFTTDDIIHLDTYTACGSPFWDVVSNNSNDEQINCPACLVVLEEIAKAAVEQ